MKTREELIEIGAESLFNDQCYGEWGTADKMVKEGYLRLFRYALTAIENAGCVVVPKVATEEMRNNIDAALFECGSLTDYGGWTGASYNFDDDAPEQVYTAMLSASPFRSEK